MTTVGYHYYGMPWSSAYHGKRDLNKLVKSIQRWHGAHHPDDIDHRFTDFDIKLDATRFRESKRSSHVGWHVDLIDNVVANADAYHQWWSDFLEQYDGIMCTKPVVKVLICDPTGTKRSVACAEILKFFMESINIQVDEPICHLSQNAFIGHWSMCTQCMLHRKQSRFGEVLKRAVQVWNPCIPTPCIPCTR